MRRRRHGIVFALLFIFYPISRFVLELIRGDNPLDAHIGPWAVTISQAVSFWALLFGIACLVIIHLLPPASPRAVPYRPPQADERK